MATAELPSPALRYRRLSAQTADRAVRETRKVQGRGVAAIGQVLVTHQVAQARLAENATDLMLAAQGITVVPDAPLSPLGFTTGTKELAGMLDQVDVDWQFARLIASLTQDAGRAAQGVAQATRPDVGWTRVLTPPSCPRCAVLAGRVYRYSDGFLRHPGDDCTTIPVRDGDSRFVSDPTDMARSGQLSGLSKADTQALLDGADLAQLVNVRRSAAGLQESGRVLYRADRMTPEAIYRKAADRPAALALLAQHGYIAA